MKTIPIAAVPLLLPLLLGAEGCLKSGQSSQVTAETTHVLDSKAGPPSRLGSSGDSLPFEDFVYPEQRWLKQRRLFTQFKENGDYETFEEKLIADGTGNFRLELTGYSPNQQTPIGPSGYWSALYDWRQRFIVKHRDVHVGAADKVLANYDFEELSATSQVAGRDCRQYLFTSRRGLGRVKLEVDVSDDVVLAWTIQDSKLRDVARLVTYALAGAPDVQGVAWSAPLASERPYLDTAADRLDLGCQPLRVRYVPAGFYSEETVLVLAAPVMAAAKNLHVEILGDGVHKLFIAQAVAPPQSGASGLPAGMHWVRSAVIGGVRIAETEKMGRSLYVVGAVPDAEMMAILGSSVAEREVR